MLLLRTSEPLSLSEFVAEGKVAEQRREGRESALDANARRQDRDSVADAGRAIDSDDGAYRTTTSGERRLEGQHVVDAEHLADMRAGLGLAVHTERDSADTDLCLRSEKAETRQTFHGDLLAQIAGLQTERLMCRAVDDHDCALCAIGVGIALDTSTDAASDLADGARVLTVALMKVQTHDASCHAIQG